MSHQNKHFIVSGLICCALTACGGGGGGETHQPSSQSTPTVSNQAQPPVIITGQTYPTTNLDLPKPNPTDTPITYDPFKVRPAVSSAQNELTKVIEYTNQLRRQKHLPPLVYDEHLAAYAQRRAEDIVGRYAHTLPDSNTQATANIHPLTGHMAIGGENLTAGKATAKETVEQWKNSPQHYAIMTNPDISKIGIGFVKASGSPYHYYWAMIVGTEYATTDYYFDTDPTTSRRHLEEALAPQARIYGDNRQDPDWLFIDGRGFKLSEKTPDGWEHYLGHAKTGKFDAHLMRQTASGFGIISENNQAFKGFYFGNHTPYEEMPQSGSATYIGKALSSDGNTAQHLDAQFKADFSHKQLTGTLIDQQQNPTHITADIRGSSFSSRIGAPVETQGSFFGTHANEIAGNFYEVSSGKRGSFGAKKAF